MTKVRLGTVIHGTLLASDLIPAFINKLETLNPEKASSYWSEIPEDALEDQDHDWWDSEEALWMLEEIFDVLNEYAPPYCYFGALEGDGSDYGFWVDRYAFEEALENGEVVKVDELPNSAPEGYEYIAVITDHGNITLYHRSEDGALHEVWSVV